MKIKTIIFSVVLCACSFVYGFAVRHFELPPHDTVRALYRKYKPYPPVQLADFTMDTAGISAGLADLGSTLETVRGNLKERVILPDDIVTISAEEVGTDKVEISARLYGITTKAVLSKAEKGDSCLRVYFQGHGGDPFGYHYHNALVKTANDAGCDFLSTSMLGIGLNIGKAEFPSGKYAGQKTRLTWREAHRHGNFFLYHDNDQPDKDALSLFLSPHYHTVKSVMNDYKDVSLLGLSGGGWYTVWMAALMPEVNHSIVYAGSLPKIYRTSQEFFGDYEEMASPVYSDVDYWQLYFLASQTTDPDRRRKLFFVFNDRDPCCFMEPSASHFKSVASEIYPDNVKVIIDAYTDHEMNPSVVEAIWEDVRDEETSFVRPAGTHDLAQFEQ